MISNFQNWATKFSLLSTLHLVYLRCVNVESRLALITPLRINIRNWLPNDVACIEPCFFDTLFNGYFCRNTSNFRTLVGSTNHFTHSPFSILSTIILILSKPYSPHANSTTVQKNKKKKKYNQNWPKNQVRMWNYAYYNQPDCDTLDMVAESNANTAQFAQYRLGKHIRLKPAHKLARIVERAGQMVDESYIL